MKAPQRTFRAVSERTPNAKGLVYKYLKSPDMEQPT
jgi:hypothetical protein